MKQHYVNHFIVYSFKKEPLDYKSDLKLDRIAGIFWLPIVSLGKSSVRETINIFFVGLYEDVLKNKFKNEFQ